MKEVAPKDIVFFRDNNSVCIDLGDRVFYVISADMVIAKALVEKVPAAAPPAAPPTPPAK